ncbi:trans-sialidase, putative, partial [Trypanosoma cruzi marinkellei]
ALCTKNGGKDGLTGIASELLSLTGEQDTKEELGTNQLKTQVLEECPSGAENCASQNAARAGFQGVREVLVARPTTVVNGTDIYMLAGIYSRGVTAGTGESGKYELGILLAGGNVSDDKGGSGKRIYWNGIDALQSSLFETQNHSLEVLFGSGGSGVKLKDGTLVFPVEGRKKGTRRAKGTVSLIIYSSEVTKGWTLSKGMSDGGCSDPSVVEWEKDGKLIMMTACDDGRRRVYEIGDKEKSWTEALGTLSRVWGNPTENERGVGSGFITARIE